MRTSKESTQCLNESQQWFATEWVRGTQRASLGGRNDNNQRKVCELGQFRNSSSKFVNKMYSAGRNILYS